MTHVTSELPQRALRILVLHQHYWPEVAATAQILADLCEDLAAQGHFVTVVCGQPSYRKTVGAFERRPRRETHRGVNIRRVLTYIPAERSVPKRLLHYASFFGASFAQCLREERPDICFVMSTPPLLLGISGLLMKKLRRVPFVYSIQDLYPDVAIHLGVIRADSTAAYVIEHVSRLCFNASAMLVTLSRGMAERVAKKGVDASRIRVVPNWADTSSICPMPRSNAFARQHGLDSGFVVQYSGNLGMSQGLDAVIGAAALLAHLPIMFVLVGDGNARERLLRDVQERELNNVRFLPPQPREMLAELLASSDVGLVTMKLGVGDDLVPSKLYGIMAAGRPVLASVEATSEVARVLDSHRCGMRVEPEDATALASAIRDLYMMPAAERDALGRRSRDACIAHYTRAAATRAYGEILSQVGALS